VLLDRRRLGAGLASSSSVGRFDVLAVLEVRGEPFSGGVRTEPKLDGLLGDSPCVLGVDTSEVLLIVGIWCEPRGGVTGREVVGLEERRADVMEWGELGSPES